MQNTLKGWMADNTVTTDNKDDKILLLESSEEQPSPEKYRRALEYLRDAGVFAAVSGVRRHFSRLRDRR